MLRRKVELDPNMSEEDMAAFIAKEIKEVQKDRPGQPHDFTNPPPKPDKPKLDNDDEFPFKH